MKLNILLYLSCFVLVCISCNTYTTDTLEVNIISQISLNDLPSASGISYYQSDIYIVGDDSPWVYKINESQDITQWLHLSTVDSLVKGRTPKKIKADFECMDLFMIDSGNYLFVISSGSNPITRDTASIINLSNNTVVAKKNIRPLFEKIKETAGITGDDEINIEGLAVSAVTAYLFHRGNISGNIIISIDLNELVYYLKNDRAAIPALTIYNFNLPGYEGTKSGFSGACMLPDKSGIMFTASMEKTDNEYDDGQIAGSYIGLIPLNGLADGKFKATLIKTDGRILLKKLEGITYKSYSDNTMVILAVSDNDDGTSDLFEMNLKIN